MIFTYMLSEKCETLIFFFNHCRLTYIYFMFMFMLYYWGLVSSRGKDFSNCLWFQLGLETHPTSYKMFFLEVRQLKFEVDAVLHLVLRLRRLGALTPYLPHVLIVQCMHMGNFNILLFCSNYVCKLYWTSFPNFQV